MKQAYLFIIGIALMCACESKNHTPIDNAAISDRSTNSENKEKLKPEDLQYVGGKLTKAGKAAMADSGKPQLIDFIVDYSSRRHSLNKFNGKPKLLGFWASWCGPCYKEKPIFRRLADKYPDIQFISLSVDKTLGEAQEYYDRRNMDVKPHDYWIGDSDANRLKWYTLRPVDDGTGHSAMVSLPAYVLIDAQGTIISKNLPYPSSGQLESYLEQVRK